MRRWFVRVAIVCGVLAAIAVAAIWVIAKRFEPFIREQAVAYIEQRFRSRAELKSLRVSLPLRSPWRIATAPLSITGEGLVLYFGNRSDLPPLIRVRKFEVESPLGALWKSPRRIRQVRLDGLEINVPSGRERRATPAQPRQQASEPASYKDASEDASKDASVIVDAIFATNTWLRMYPSDPEKSPREFEIHRLRLKGAGRGRAMHYTAQLTNPKPRGLIDATGEFGPWQGDDPGDTPVSGRYDFRDADLATIRGIAGILQSNGEFSGVLRRIEVRGKTRTPDFRLTLSGNAVPLNTEFISIVDGTTGDTLLQPVRATLGRTYLVARGGVIRRKGVKRRTVALDVVMNKGRLEDVLRLAMKGNDPIMEGEINLRTKLQILPSDLAVIEKLLLDGSFDLQQATFAAGGVQEKIDMLSRRAQGQPKNQQIADVLSAIRGAFKLREGEITFSDLSFQVPGAAIDLKGRYGLYDEALDFRGTARLQAKVSQTMSGWKRWALKPVDPFFSKNGAGTFLSIKVTGTRDKPEFGLDKKDKGKT